MDKASLRLPPWPMAVAAAFLSAMLFMITTIIAPPTGATLSATFRVLVSDHVALAFKLWALAVILSIGVVWLTPMAAWVSLIAMLLRRHWGLVGTIGTACIFVLMTTIGVLYADLFPQLNGPDATILSLRISGACTLALSLLAIALLLNSRARAHCNSSPRTAKATMRSALLSAVAMLTIYLTPIGFIFFVASPQLSRLASSG